MGDLNEVLRQLFLEDGNEIPEWMVAIRSVLIYALAIVIVRAGKKRFMAGTSAFDVLVGVMLGSILGRGINGGSNLLGSVLASAVIVFLHWLFSYIAVRSSGFERIVKGTNSTLVRDGQVNEEELRQHHITHEDLMAALRSSGVGRPDDVKEAVIEQSGEISVQPSSPKVLDVQVENGVQTIRIKLV